MQKVTSYQSDFLDDYLLKDIIKEKKEEVEISIPFFLKDGSDTYVFLDSIDGFKLKYYKKESKAYSNLSINQIQDFILQNNINNLRKVKLIILIDGNEKTDSIINWLETEIERESENYTLFNGYWYTFNDDYLNRINEKVIMLENKILQKKDSFSVSEKEIWDYFDSNEEKILQSFSKKKERPYREYVYNYILCQKENWELFDRITYDTIEVCDINVINKAYIHVKFGTTKDLEVVFRQSLYGTKYINNKPKKLYEKTNKNNKNLSEADYVIILFLTDKNLDNFLISNRKSLKCKMTFIDWYDEITKMEYKSIIMIAQYSIEKSYEKNIYDRLNDININYLT